MFVTFFLFIIIIPCLVYYSMYSWVVVQMGALKMHEWKMQERKIQER